MHLSMLHASETHESLCISCTFFSKTSSQNIVIVKKRDAACLQKHPRCDAQTPLHISKLGYQGIVCIVTIAFEFQFHEAFRSDNLEEKKKDIERAS